MPRRRLDPCRTPSPESSQLPRRPRTPRRWKATLLDLNADLGESFGSWKMGDDAAMFQLVTSANVACGFHAGDPVTMLDSCRAAYELDVTVGAHVGYRDLAGFGRRSLDTSFDE